MQHLACSRTPTVTIAITSNKMSKQNLQNNLQRFVEHSETSEKQYPVSSMSWFYFSLLLRCLLCSQRNFFKIRGEVKNIHGSLLLVLIFIAVYSVVQLVHIVNIKHLIFFTIRDHFRNLKDIDGNPYFQNYFESFYQLYILTTTANSPDVG